MTANLTRRSLAAQIGRAGIGVGALALLAPNAQADTPFTSFAFPAAGASTPRTMPDRLAEIKNVLDFGADPSGNSDSTAAIQAAIDWTSGPNRGTIFFPLGRYFVTRPLMLNYSGNLSISFVGAPGTLIFGNFNDYIFKRSLSSPNNTPGGRIFEKLSIQNAGNTGGCIQLGSTDGACVRDCVLSAHICVTTEDSSGTSSTNVLFENCIFTTMGTVAGSHAIIIGGSGAMMGCDCHNADTGFRIYGSGFHASGNRTENCNTAFLLGIDSAGTNQGASGFSITSGTTEGNGTAFDFVGTCTGFVIGPYTALGHDSSNSGCPLGVQSSQYGLRMRAGNAQAGVINSLGAGSVFDQAGIAIENAASRSNVIFIGCTSHQSGGAGVNWALPTNAYTAQFYNCNTQPIWTFTQLPSGAGNVFEGDEFSIIDSPTAIWGASVTSGGGSNHVLVRWNGSSWTVVGV